MTEAAVEIKPEELASHLREYSEAADKVVVFLNPERNVAVTLGVPVVETDLSDFSIVIPDEPHVFMVHHLWVTDRSHQDLLLTDVPVVLAHGYRDGNMWRFYDGQSVSETVTEYDDYARLNNLPPLQFVISCNSGSQEDGVYVGDLPGEKKIVQAVGENVSMHLGHESEMSEEGRVTLTVGVKGAFMGLDGLIEHKSALEEVNVVA